MPIYSYKGYDAKSGANRKGKVEADTEKAAKQLVKQRDKVIVAEIKEEAAANKKGESVSLLSQLRGPSVSINELAVMVRQFATLQNAHVPLDECIKALVSQMENPVLRGTLSAVKDSISEGKSLADASREYPGIFNKLYVNMVRAGESSGTLGTVLERLADFMEYQVKVRGQIMQAMMYPLIMIIASVVIIIGMLVFMVPKLAKVFASMKVKIPWYTQIVLDLSDFLRSSWYMVPLFAGLIYIGVKFWLSSEKGKRQLDVIKIKAPIFGPVFLMISVSRFTKTLSTLLSSGVPIIQALDITKNVVNNMILTEVIEQAKIEVQEGKSLSGCIARSGVFPGLVVHMIATGERSGELEEMLGHVAKAYDTEVENKINKMISLIEPLMMVVLMGLAGGIIGAVIIPMMDIMKQVR